MSENNQPQEQKELKKVELVNKIDNKKGLQCRICLSKIQSDQIMDVCQCKGSSGSIHKHCLVEWMKSSKKYYRNGLKYYFDCEVCKYPMELQSSLKVRCCQSTHECNTQYVLFNLLMIFLLVVSLLLIILPKTGIMDQLEPSLRDALMIIGIVSLVIEVVLYLIYHLVIISPGIVGVRKVELQNINQKQKPKKETTKQQTQETNPQTIQQIYSLNGYL